MRSARPILAALGLLLAVPFAGAQELGIRTATITVDTSPAGKRQVIDGFGALQGDASRNTTWWQELFYDDLGASIYRVDLTPRFISPYSNLSYYSPWFMGSSTDHVLNLEDPDNPDGPEGNRVRTYTGADDYSRLFGGERAPIAVMGPDIDDNVAYFNYATDGAVRAGDARRTQLGDFKLIGSLWSPAPWVKVTSGNDYPANWWPGPVQGTPWPFIWGGNFAGGMLDVSGEPRDAFDDSALGGTGPTSALTQFARSTAAYIKGYQDFFGVRFYAISIQNELNFEQFYNSATYPLSSQYIAAVKAVRSEFDLHDDLRDIKIMGPEDLLGGDAYGLWQYGGGNDVTHKNLQYLRNIAADAEADEAVDFFAIHGYAPDGVNAAGAEPTQWEWWANGWTASPAAGIPPNVQGFTSFEKKSWMTETSGEQQEWLSPATGFPSNGGWSIALKIHQALTVGQQSAWIYWTFSETEDGRVSVQALTNQALRAASPKYVAAKHFFRFIRPDAHCHDVEVAGSPTLHASAYVHAEDQTLTAVLINSASSPETATVVLPGYAGEARSVSTFTSSEGSLWEASTTQLVGGATSVTVPGYGVVTLHMQEYTPTSAGREADLPDAIQLFQNYPNPFNPNTTIRFGLQRPGHVELVVSDVLGREVATLLSDRLEAGYHDIDWNASHFPSGVYYYRIQSGSETSTRKLVLMR